MQDRLIESLKRARESLGLSDNDNNNNDNTTTTTNDG